MVTQAEQGVQQEQVRLFRAKTVVPEHRGFKDVDFDWFVVRRAKPVVSYEDWIRDYDLLKEEPYPEVEYARGIVDELLTAAEIEELRHYLEVVHGSALVVEEKLAPLDCRGQIGFGALAVGGPSDFYMLSSGEGYNLSVEVWGYYNLEAGCCELTDAARAARVARHVDETLSDFTNEESRTIARLLLEGAERAGSTG